MQQDSNPDIWTQQFAWQGNRLIIEDITKEAFFAQEQAILAWGRARGIELGLVYHEPIHAGIVTVKKGKIR